MLLLLLFLLSSMIIVDDGGDSRSRRRRRDCYLKNSSFTFFLICFLPTDANAGVETA